MKRRKPLRILLIAVPLALLIALASYFAYWNWPTHLYSIDPDEIYSVELQNGPYYREITDRGIIKHLANHLNSLTFRRRLDISKQVNYPLRSMGGSSLSFRTKNGKLISVVFRQPQIIPSGDFWWEAYPPGVDYAYLSELMPGYSSQTEEVEP